jgi:hypothetical protein
MGAAVFNHQIEVDQPSPGIEVLVVEQPIADGTANEGDSIWPCGGEQHRPEGGRNTRQVQGALGGEGENHRNGGDSPGQNLMVKRMGEPQITKPSVPWI